MPRFGAYNNLYISNVLNVCSFETRLSTRLLNSQQAAQQSTITSSTSGRLSLRAAVSLHNMLLYILIAGDLVLPDAVAAILIAGQQVDLGRNGFYI